MNAPDGREPVLVGVSRSEAAVWAVRWAADEAWLRGLPLLVVHAQEWPSAVSPTVVPGESGSVWASHFRAVGRSLVDTARAEALLVQPDLDVQVGLAEGKPREVLRRLAEDAFQLVLGTRRLGDVEAAFVRSRGARLFGQVPCPVVLVPPPHAPQPERDAVVVGVDGSRASEAAVAYAYEEANLHRVPLVALEVRPARGRTGAETEEEARLDLAEALAGWREKYPQVEVEQRILTGDPARLLQDAASHARCLVVGSHGRGGLREALLGSTTRSLVHHTHSPLVVVPPDYTGRPR